MTDTWLGTSVLAGDLNHDGTDDLLIGAIASVLILLATGLLLAAYPEHAARIYAANLLGSSISRETDPGVYPRVGPEIGVASTKAFTTQLVALYLIALYLGQHLDKLSRVEVRQRLNELVRLPTWVQETLDLDVTIRDLAQQYMNAQNFLYLGRGLHYPIALEGALKLKEISYIHAEGFAAGELKHGPIALLDEKTPVVAIATRGHTYEKMLSNIKEVKARDAVVIAVADAEDTEIAKYVDMVLRVPSTDEILSPILSTVVLQLLAYYTALARGCSIDKPRNLAKSVTVE